MADKVKISALVLSVLVFPVTSIAQITVGPKIGYNTTWKQSGVLEKQLARDGFDDNSQIESRKSMQWGALVNYILSPRWSAQAELLYTQKGQNVRYFFDRPVNWPTVSSYRDDYLELPLLARHTFLTKGRWQGFLLVGPSVGYWLSSRATGTYEPVSLPRFDDDPDVPLISYRKRIETVVYDLDANERAVRIEIGANAGTGLAYRSPVGQFTVEARLSAALTNPFEDGTLENYGAFRNRGVVIALAYALKIK